MDQKKKKVYKKKILPETTCSPISRTEPLGSLNENDLQLCVSVRVVPIDTSKEKTKRSKILRTWKAG